MVFTIDKGKHYSSFWFGLTFKKHIACNCTLTPSCLYNIGEVENYDINKLVGISTAINHHNQSARIGWRCLDGKTFEILTYTYSDGKRVETEDTILGVVKPDEEFIIIIEDRGNHFTYSFASDTIRTVLSIRKSPSKLWFSWILKPYFGGTTPAPHEMKVIATI